jgi:hypothetical protein
VRAQTGVDLPLDGRLHAFGEHDLAAAANAVAECAQAVGGRRAVTRKAAAFATGCRLAALVQRACKVPSRCSSAFEVFCAAGSDAASVLAGAAAYGNVSPPPSGNT